MPCSPAGRRRPSRSRVSAATSSGGTPRRSAVSPARSSSPEDIPKDPLIRRLGGSITCLAFLMAAPPSGRAASLPYAVRAWTIEEGIPTSTVQDIAQTPDGYLWLTTTGGLARFDGVRFRVFGLAQGLPTNRFQGLAVDRSGVLWISSEDGTLVRWDGRAFT